LKNEQLNVTTNQSLVLSGNKIKLKALLKYQIAQNLDVRVKLNKEIGSLLRENRLLHGTIHVLVMEFSSLENKRIQLENVIQSSRIACDATVEAKIVRKVEGNVTLTINGGSGDADSMKQFLEESFEQDSWIEDPDVIRQIDESQMVPVGRM
jgi:hypothetical protein